MRILIVSSGAGGHLFCGLNIAEEIKIRHPEIVIYFLGANNKLAKKIVTGRGFDFYGIYTGGLCKKDILGVMDFLFKQIIGVIQSAGIFLKIRPNVVLSTGGFVSLGAVFWSKIFKRQCLVHEQNTVPGKANKMAAYFADKILVTFENTKDIFKGKKCVVTGMPVRFDETIQKATAREKLGLDKYKFTVLFMGGSMGAHKINEVAISMLSGISEQFQFIHLTGNNDFDWVKSAYKKYNFNSHVEKFSTNMNLIYSASDLVVCRAGSGTLSEITYFGLPSILIPYPHSADKHQYKNAEVLEKNKAAFMISEESLSSDKLIDLINRIANSEFSGMAEKSKSLAKPEAASIIVDEIMKMVCV